VKTILSFTLSGDEEGLAEAWRRMQAWANMPPPGASYSTSRTSLSSYEVSIEQRDGDPAQMLSAVFGGQFTNEHLDNLMGRGGIHYPVMPPFDPFAEPRLTEVIQVSRFSISNLRIEHQVTPRLERRYVFTNEAIADSDLFEEYVTQQFRDELARGMQQELDREIERVYAEEDERVLGEMFGGDAYVNVPARRGLTEECAARYLGQWTRTSELYLDFDTYREQHRQEEERRAEIARQREEAEQRANELLKSVIGEEAYKTLLDEWYLHVGSPNCEWRKYAIPLHKDRRILFWDEKGHYELCIAPASDVPAADRVLTHYFMIQGDEEAHLRIANFFDKDGNQIANPYRNTVPSNDLLNLWNDITVDRRERERRRDAGAFTPFIPDDMQVNGEMEADRDGVWQRLRDAVIEDVTPPLETVCDAVATALERLPQSGIFQRILDSRRTPTREFISWDRSIGDDASAIVAGRTDEDGVVHINEITYETVYVPIDRANNSQEE
jgi:hypothetical protein